MTKGSTDGVKGKCVYLSGPMAGQPDDNREAFRAAERAVRGAGALWVFNPANAWVHDGFPREWYLAHDLHELTSWIDDYAEVTGNGSRPEGVPYYDLLVSLPGWEDSEGATLEVAVAQACGIECAELSELDACWKTDLGR